MSRAANGGEAAILKSILIYLQARHVLAFRQNVGAVEAVYHGNSRFMRFGVPGMADVLAFPYWLMSSKADNVIKIIKPLWIEVKTATGKQSDLQKSFQQQVESHGHKYVIARSIEDVEEALR